MRAVPRARALFVGTVGLGFGALTVAAFARSDVSLATLALLGAAAILTEFIQIPGDDSSPAPGDAHAFSFSTCVHVATILLVGPWTAGLVAAFGVVVVDRLRGEPWRKVGFNASVFALAAVSGGFAFELFGGDRGHVELPGDFAALVALAVTYYVVNTAFTCGIVALSGGSPFPSLFWGSIVDGAGSFAAEAGLGVALAFLAELEPWALAVLVPLLFAVYRSYERLATLRRETTRALETFASVVDHRDPYTFEHSARVAGYVRGLAQRLGLPLADVERLRWAGRVHDLGKIAVDASVLRKPGKLDADEWAALRRHPRLSAHLLRRFRLASDEARAVEAHHERFDGKGYYGLGAFEVPLAAHFLIVADTFDAMTTDRPYRRALTAEEALAEIERESGSQFHPAVAKAFVAWRRGLDPGQVLTAEERRSLRRLWGSRRPPAQRLRQLAVDRELVAAGALTLGLVLVGIGEPLAALASAAVAVAALASRTIERIRTDRLGGALVAALAAAPSRQDAIRSLADRLVLSAPLRWAGLVAWQERDLAGVIESGWSSNGRAPSVTELSSWLAREADATTLFVETPNALGRDQIEVAVALRTDGVRTGFLVLSFGTPLPRRVAAALAARAAKISDLLAADREGPERRLPLAAVR
jgi:HD-GYP domain-containing protein (c-di-GMP phosphodiesterase class II)